MSVLAFAGAAQFAAVGYVATGLAVAGDRPADRPAQRAPPALLGGAGAVAPRRPVRAAGRSMAHLLTDEAFALAIGHFRRLGRPDEWGYWFGAIVVDVHPVEPGDAGRGGPRRRDRRPDPVRARHRVPGGDDRPGGRPASPVARGRRRRDGRDRRRRRGTAREPSGRDHRGRGGRAVGRAASCRPGSRTRPRRWRRISATRRRAAYEPVPGRARPRPVRRADRAVDGAEDAP